MGKRPELEIFWKTYIPGQQVMTGTQCHQSLGNCNESQEHQLTPDSEGVTQTKRLQTLSRKQG